MAFRLRLAVHARQRCQVAAHTNIAQHALTKPRQRVQAPALVASTLPIQPPGGKGPGMKEANSDKLEGTWLGQQQILGSKGKRKNPRTTVSGKIQIGNGRWIALRLVNFRWTPQLTYLMTVAEQQSESSLN